MIKFLKGLFQKENTGMKEALSQGAVIVDVRTKDEFRQGHIAGSKNIPLNEIKQKLEGIRGWNKPVITVCRSGNRSAIAKNILKAGGIDVYNGGAWNRMDVGK